MSTRHSHSHSHSHSPKTPTKMLDRALSSRRSPPYSDFDFPSTAASSAVSPDPESANLVGDESKTKKPHLYLLATNYISRLGLVKSPCLCLSLCLLLSVFMLFSLMLNSRSFVCVSSYDPISRASFLGLDGLDSDFGSLGVPWCKFSYYDFYGVLDRICNLLYFLIFMFPPFSLAERGAVSLHNYDKFTRFASFFHY